MFDSKPYRALFPVTDNWAYLNHATHGPLPLSASGAISQLAHQWGNPADLDHGRNQRTVRSVRELAAGLMDGRAENVAFTGNLAESMSLAATGIDWQPGDNCVVPAGEFPSVIYPFLNLRHRGVEVRIAPKGPDGFTSLEEVRKLMDQRTRAVAMSHVEFQNGFRNDLAALGTLCRERDVLSIVDVTQSLGPCEIDVDAAGIDVAAAHSYKWLMGSYGVGVTHLSSRAIERIRPTYAGRLTVASGFESLDYELTCREGAERYQTGGLNWITLAGLEASLTLITSIGTRAIQHHTLTLTESLLDGLERQGFETLSSRDERHRSAIVAFSTGNNDRNAELVSGLAGAQVSVVQRGPGIRVSPYFYNTFDEIEQLLSVTESFAR